VLELREKHGASIYQIGYMLDASPSTVRGHLRAAERNLRRAFVPLDDGHREAPAAGV
jgi:hypothetical protein